MNYIERLQTENKELKGQLEQIKSELDSFRIFLNSAKFQGFESDGSRKDWISTNDVQNRLKEISLTIC